MLSILLSILYRFSKFKRGEYPLSILYYHHVFNTTESYHPDDLCAQQFEQQIAFLTKHFHLLTLTEALSLLKQKKLPPKALVISFDDGYQDNANVAAPLLRKYQCPATFFIATEGVETGVLWNDKIEQCIKHTQATKISAKYLGKSLPLSSESEKISAYHQLVSKLKFEPNEQRTALIQQLISELQVTQFTRTMMTEQQIKQLSKQQFEIGAHTHSHTIVATESAQSAQQELQQNKLKLEAITAQPISLLAFPNGLFGRDYLQQHCELAKQLGFEAAFSTNDGGATSNTNLFQIPRFMPYRKQLPLFALSIAKIAGDHA